MPNSPTSAVKADFENKKKLTSSLSLNVTEKKSREISILACEISLSLSIISYWADKRASELVCGLWTVSLYRPLGLRSTAVYFFVTIDSLFSKALGF